MKSYWKVNGVLTLPWGEYADMITKVVINEGINDIGQMAFYELPHLTEVVLPESVENICAGAFYGCSALENVTITEGTTVADWAFSGTGVVLP